MSSVSGAVTLAFGFVWRFVADDRLAPFFFALLDVDFVVVELSSSLQKKKKE